MTPYRPFFNNTRVLSVWLALVGLLMSGRAIAQEEDAPGRETSEPDYAPDWTGTSWGFGAVAGAFVLRNEGFEDTLGLAFGAQARVSIALQLADLHLTYFRASSSPTTRDRVVDITTDSVSASVAVHPLFLGAFEPGRLGPFLASFYILAGISFEFAEFESPEARLSESWEVGWHLGLGLDYPVTDPDGSGALWLGGQYRWNNVPTEFGDIDAVNDNLMHQHLFFLIVSYRINGLPF